MRMDYFAKMRELGWNLEGDYEDYLELHLNQLEDAFRVLNDELEELNITEPLAFILDFVIAVKEVENL